MTNNPLAELLGTDTKTSPPFDLKAVLKIVRRFYWIVLLFVIAAAAAAFAYLKTATPVFRATAELRIERRPMIVSSSGMVADNGVSTESDLLTLKKCFLSKDLFLKVADRLSAKERASLVGSDDADSLVETDAVAGAIRKDSGIVLVEGTRLMDLSFDHADPALAVKVVNLLLSEGIKLDTDQRINAMDSNLRFLQTESEKLESKLTRAEENLNAYTKELGTVAIDDNLNVVAEQFREANARYVAARTLRLTLESDFQQITDANGDPEKLVQVGSVQKLPAVARLLEREAQIQAQMADLTQRYRPDNPRVLQMQEQLQTARQELNKELQTAPAIIQASVTTAQRTEESLNKERAAQERQVIQIKEASVKSKVLQRQIDADKLAYETVLRRLNEEISQVRAQPVIIQVVEEAAGAVQVKPKPAQVLLIALFLGGALGVGVVFLLMQMDSSVHSVEEAERVLGIPVMAVVPKSAELFAKGNQARASGENTGGNWKSLPVFVDKHSTSAEAFRTLNASVQMAEEAEHENFMLVTSSLPSEGKSFVCLNAAVAAALSGQRTLLVDADLRKPVVESRFFGTRGREGLADFLSGRRAMDELVTPSGLEGLDILTAGKHNADPAEILSRKRFKALLDEAASKYDRIIFDSAPVSVVSDTLCFARYFHVVCVVTRAGKTPKNTAKRTLELLRRAGAKPTGLIVNYVTKEFQSGYYGYYNYHSPYYGHTETETADRKA